MSSLTDGILKHRGIFSRYKRFVLPAAIILVVLAGTVAVGFYLFEKSEKNNLSNEAQAQSTLPASWLIKYFGTDNENDPRIGGVDADPDGDVLTNWQEFYFNTDPTNPDTDNDGQWDGAEVAFNSNPTGEGELYNTDYARSVADRFIEQYRLDELKEENIKSQVLGILNPLDSEKIEIPFLDAKLLNLTTDISNQAVEKYLTELRTVGGDLGGGNDLLLKAIENPQSVDLTILLGQTYETIDRLRNTQVPIPFLNFHQLHIAALSAAARILEISQTLNPLADPAIQQDKLSQQYYQVQVIEKIQTFLDAETLRLKDQYNEVIEKFIKINE